MNVGKTWRNEGKDTSRLLDAVGASMKPIEIVNTSKLHTSIRLNGKVYVLRMNIHDGDETLQILASKSHCQKSTLGSNPKHLHKRCVS